MGDHFAEFRSVQLRRAKNIFKECRYPEDMFQKWLIENPLPKRYEFTEDSFVTNYHSFAEKRKFEIVMEALIRCSRDRWILPCEVHQLAGNFAKCVQSYYGNYVTLAGKAISSLPIGATQVGLLRGTTPFEWGSACFGEAAQKIKSYKPLKYKRGVQNEMFLFNLIIRLKRKYG